MKRFKDFLIGASLVLFVASGMLLIAAINSQSKAPLAPQAQNIAPTATLTPSETFPPSTPLPTLTPSSTLRPPPTFEPPTLTRAPSLTPSETPSPTYQLSVDLPGVHGLETATPSTTPGCQVRREWTLTYEVRVNDALERIAQLYGTTSWELAEANCLTDANMIYVGQQLRVPGETQSGAPIECVTWEVLTPIENAYNIDGSGSLTFNWRGPRAPRNLIRVYNSNGEVVLERTVDLRQNETIFLPTDLPGDGTFTWYVFPLDWNFLQIPCHEGGPWTFHKNAG